MMTTHKTEFRKPPPPRPRKIVQLTATAGTNAEGELFALCDDGTVWTLTYAGQWQQLPAIPQSNGGNPCWPD